MISQYPPKILKILTIYSCILYICHASHPYKLVPALQYNNESFINLGLHEAGRRSIVKQWKLSYRNFGIWNLLAIKVAFPVLFFMGTWQSNSNVGNSDAVVIFDKPKAV